LPVPVVMTVSFFRRFSPFFALWALIHARVPHHEPIGVRSSRLRALVLPSFPQERVISLAFVFPFQFELTPLPISYAHF